MILGYLRLLRLVFAISFNGTMDKALPGYAAEAGELWRHSLITALACEAIAKMGTPVQTEPPIAFTEVGGCLMQRWKLPAEIVAAVSYHHKPTYQPGPELSALVHVADALAHTEDCGFAPDALAAGSAPGVLDSLQLTPDKMAGLSAVLQQALIQVDHLMELK
jgi:HD-like signal output (HDOD) protein